MTGTKGTRVLVVLSGHGIDRAIKYIKRYF
jgi:hypothetical protein